MPQQIPDLAPKLKAMGFEGDPAAFADLTGQPMGAIVSLGGCTASFVSPEGLIATNHHCVHGPLQYNSTPQRNLLGGRLPREDPRGGALERSRLPRARDRLRQGGDRRDHRQDRPEARRPQALRPRRAAGQGADGRVRGGRPALPRRRPSSAACRYFEIAQLEIQDVRLVYAPADGIGNFGGETDNWRWPRHTGDWSFYRAYVGKDGKPAAFSKDNVPYKPARWLPVQPAGVKEGDLVFVVGYPGRTQRHQTYAEVKETTEWSFPRFIKSAQEQIAILEALGKTDHELQIKAAGRAARPQQLAHQPQGPCSRAS